MASLIYGAGLRLMECLRLRVKDIDFAYRQITVRDGKGQKDRITMGEGVVVVVIRRANFPFSIGHISFFICRQLGYFKAQFLFLDCPPESSIKAKKCRGLEGAS
jgi:hypothetical protein